MTTIIMTTMIWMIMTMIILTMVMIMRMISRNVDKKRATFSAQINRVKMLNSVMSVCLLSSFDIETGSSERFLLRPECR